jgi:hypothetical protein
MVVDMRRARSCRICRCLKADQNAGETQVATEKIRIEQHSAAGTLWFAGWLFTIAFLHLSFWKGALALIVWPYFIGKMISGLVTP